jgi:hypothetical protein
MSFLGNLLFGRQSTTTPISIQIENDEVAEGLDLALSFLESGNEVDQNLNPESVIISTPTVKVPTIFTPTHQQKSGPSPLSRPSSIRKVTFESITEGDFHYSSSPSRVLSPLKPLPSSEERPQRSILKPFRPSSLSSVIRREFESFEEMLDNVVHQLAAGDHRTRIDAYQAFLNAVQAKLTVPEQDALLDATRSLLEFIYRDVQYPSQSTNNPLTTWALKFLANLARTVPITEQQDFDGFGNLLDFSTSILERAEVPKTIIQHHMLYLCQKFNSKILTTERATRILACLNKIHERVQGSNVKVYRLIIYQQYFETIPQVMISKASEWLPNMLNCLLSNKSEVRQHATSLGTMAALRHAKPLNRAIEDILASKNGDTTFMDLFIGQLRAVLLHKDREMALAVPRIWAIMALFLRPRFHKSEFWHWYKPWLAVCSDALNSQDRQIKFEAYTAWKKFIFSVMPDKQTIPAVRQMLRSPFADPFLKQRELQQGTGRAMMSAYLCLLYYALRPSATPEDLDIYWNEYLSSVLTNFLCPKKQGQQVYCAASILQSLFSSQEKWVENRANSAQPFEIDELPRIDPTWIRSRLPKVLELVEAVLTHPESWKTSDVGKSDGILVIIDSLALSTWSALLESVREAGAKEITVSVALKSSIATIMNTLHKVAKWLEHNAGSTVDAAKSFQTLAECAVSRLGASNFTDRMLMRNPDSQNFEVASTPSHRPQPGLRSPITHLVELQIKLGLEPKVSETSKHLESVKVLVARCMNTLSLRSSKLALIADLFDTLQSRFSSDETSQLVRDVADHLLELAEEITRPTLTGLNAPAMSAKDFESILAICKHSILVRRQAPKLLYAHTADSAKQTTGTGGLLLAVTEPHALMIHQYMTNDDGSRYETLLTYTQAILDRDVRPRNWGAVERGRKALSNGTITPNYTSKNPDLEYTNLSALVNYSLRYGYAQLRPSGDAQSFADLFESLFQYFNRAPGVSYAIFLRQIQDGISIVLGDPDFHIRDSSERGKSNLLSAVSTSSEITPLDPNNLLDSYILDKHHAVP